MSYDGGLCFVADEDVSSCTLPLPFIFFFLRLWEMFLNLLLFSISAMRSLRSQSLKNFGKFSRKPCNMRFECHWRENWCGSEKIHQMRNCVDLFCHILFGHDIHAVWGRGKSVLFVISSFCNMFKVVECSEWHRARSTWNREDRVAYLEHGRLLKSGFGSHNSLTGVGSFAGQKKHSGERDVR